MADPDLIKGVGGGHPGPGMGGGGLNNFFLALRASVWSRSKVLFSQQKKRSMLIVIIEKKIITSADHQNIGRYQCEVYHNVSTVYYQSSPGKKFDSSRVD